MGDKSISTDIIMKDLGIIFQENLKFDVHISKIVASANSKVGIIRRAFHVLLKENFMLLYKSFVRPILEYCCTTWSPYLIMHHKEIEKVQKRATKLVSSLHHLSYSSRLKKLNLTTLYYRRLRSDMIQIFRIVNGIDKIDVSHLFTFSTRPSRGNSLKLVKPRALTTLKQHTFSHRVISLWNDLPNEVVTAKSINEFKNKLEKVWLHKEFKYYMVYEKALQ